MNDAPAGTPGRAVRAVRAVETALLAGVLGAMVLLAATQIVLRNGWGAGIDWADEALRLMVLWVAMLGAVAASGEQRHVSIDALSRYLPPAVGRVVARLVNAVATGVCAVLAWYSWRFVAESWAAGEMLLGGRLPAWTAEAVLPAGFGIMAVRYALATLRPPGRPAGATGH